MGCCMYKKWLKLLGGLGLIYASYLANGMTLKLFDPWMVLGLMFFLVGVCPLVCKCDCCTECKVDYKKKK